MRIRRCDREENVLIWRRCHSLRFGMISRWEVCKNLVEFAEIWKLYENQSHDFNQVHFSQQKKNNKQYNRKFATLNNSMNMHSVHNILKCQKRAIKNEHKLKFYITPIRFVLNTNSAEEDEIFDFFEFSTKIAFYQFSLWKT